MADRFNMSDSHVDGRQTLKSIAAPGAGNAASWDYSAYNKIFLMSLRFKLNTDANVATRIVTLSCEDTSGKIMTQTSSVLDNAAVSSTYVHSWGALIDGDTQEVGAFHYDHGHIPGVWVPGTYTWRINVDNIQVGDTLTEIETWFRYQVAL